MKYVALILLLIGCNDNQSMIKLEYEKQYLQRLSDIERMIREADQVGLKRDWDKL